jgi:hypothetical protein
VCIFGVVVLNGFDIKHLKFLHKYFWHQKSIQVRKIKKRENIKLKNKISINSTHF